MKILSQNKQQIINFNQTYKLYIESNNKKMPQITAESPQGVKACLGIYMPKEADMIIEELLACTAPFFKMPRSQRYSGGRVLSDSDLEAIMNNFTISKYAMQRMVQRGLFDETPSTADLHNEVKRYLKNNVLAFWNEDGTANIAVDAYHYFVVQYTYNPKGYTILTYSDVSENGYNVFDKRKIALNSCKQEEKHYE